MRKWKFIILIVLLFTIIFNSNVKASIDEISDIKESKEIEELYDYISNMKSEYEILNDMNVKKYIENSMKTGEGDLSIKKIGKTLIGFLFKELATSIKLMSVIVIIAIICSLITNLEMAFSNESLSNIAYFACYSLLIVIMARSFYLGVDLARVTIERMSNFMLILVPVLVMLLFSVGGVAEAAVMDPVVIISINLASKIFAKILIPLISMVFVLQFVNNITEEYKIDKLTKLLNQIALWGQGILMTVFIGIMTIRGITSKTLDQVVAKTAKYAVDNFIPIVGKCLSDAVSTVAGYSVLLKDAISGLGLVMLIVMVSFPTIKLLINAFVYKLTAALIEPIGDKRLVNSISSAGDSLVLISSCVICVSIMFFIMISIIAAAGKMAIGG
ncbi:stage III sporulation protein AE [Clostridium cochlearium]|uniref:Stage III sporulation protein AE n=1 Tax=Clostridium cochlearium TaxID=1494 RepID=A0A240A9L0_CLOCO|nr:stage III sporulation protein AE [Clostridium cochlearium]MBV1816971.1 stage III sporulation protein AE [Bacteroidales bacterium MSK.15.36]NSJ90773.1 stage III sporulation protein AE [Coprococcus sp. MSK.21.13]MBE6065348.1 stage III sporulation protein AE [Clostridium cochlearium]MBU5268990.1 stage III sporulation protein AE [Clostridium cochlearium]MCG4570723.1 stage III sporulation protein AE [Clostridium cochlearium]